MEAAFGVSVFVFLYGLWRREKIWSISLTLHALLLISIAVVGYRANVLALDEVNPNFSFFDFIVVSFLMASMALYLFLPSLPWVLTGKAYYSHDRPLVIAEAVLTAIAVTIYLLYRKSEEKEKRDLTAQDNPAPSESSSGQAEP